MKNNLVTGKDMAKKAGISEQAFSGYVNAKNLPASNVLAEWAVTLNMDINWLLTGNGEMLRGQGQDAGSYSAQIAQLEERIQDLRYTVELQKQMLADNGRNFKPEQAAKAVPTDVRGTSIAAPLLQEGIESGFDPDK